MTWYIIDNTLNTTEEIRGATWEYKEVPHRLFPQGNLKEYYVGDVIPSPFAITVDTSSTTSILGVHYD